MTRPTDIPDWSPPSGDVEAPSPAKRALGWLAERPSRRTFNWFWQNVSQWLTWLAQGQVYDSLPALIDDTAAGDHATACATETQAWEELQASSPLTAGGTDGSTAVVRSSGRYAVSLLIRSAPSGAYFLLLHDLLDGVDLWSETINATAAMDFDGRYIYVADDDEVVVYDLEATGGLAGAVEVGRWTSKTGRPVTHLAVNGPYLVTVEDNTTTGSVEGWDRSADPTDADWVWSYTTDIGSTSNDVKDLRVSGAGRVLIAKNDNTNDNLVVLNASTGALINRLDVGGANNNGVAVVGDDERIFLAVKSDAVYLLDADATAATSFFSASTRDAGLALDGEYLCVLGSNLAAVVRKDDQPDSARKLFAWTPSGVHSNPFTACALDGGALLLGAWKRSADNATLATQALPARVRSVRRVEPTVLKPYPSLLVIPE